MIWPGKFWHWTLLDRDCVHSTMTWGAAMSAAADRITVKEVKASRQSRSSTWILLNVIHIDALIFSKSLFYFVPPWLQTSTPTLFLLPQHQLCRRRRLKTITQFDPCTIQSLQTSRPYFVGNNRDLTAYSSQLPLQRLDQAGDSCGLVSTSIRFPLWRSLHSFKVDLLSREDDHQNTMN